MKKIASGSISLVIASAAVVSGCAGVSFYADPELTKSTGIPIYAPKPYVLLSRTGAKDKPVDVSIVYLNDTSKVVYAKPHSGFGSAKLSLALSNGQMTSFGQETDPKIPELIASLSGMITAQAGAGKTGAEAKKILSEIEQGADYVATGAKVKAVADDIAASLKARKLDGLTGDERKDVSDAKDALLTAAATLSNPTHVEPRDAALKVVKAQTEVLSKISDIPGGLDRAEATGRLKGWAAKLASLFDNAQPEKPKEAAFELYEIVRDGATTTLKRVGP
ncbi:MAG TPA: hypothetical protein PK999_16920 [Nitrospira sp.]|nr:hypothetical protein [Nitrospira sp.]